MDTSLIILLSLFLIVYAFSVVSHFADRMYWMCVNINEREQEEEEKEKNKEIPDSCKHIYS